MGGRPALAKPSRPLTHVPMAVPRERREETGKGRGREWGR
jgi:hypothetical protein